MKHETKSSHCSASSNQARRKNLRMVLAVTCLAILTTGLAGLLSHYLHTTSVSAQTNSANPPNATSQTQDNLQFTRSAETERKFAELAEKARSRGRVRVIIGVRLSVSYRSEGFLANQQDAETQRQHISQAQESLLSRLSGVNRESVKQFKHIPFMALAVSAEELDQLKASPEVFSIQEDRLSKPTLVDSTRIIGADAAWASGFTGAGQSVAILDTGVDSTHPAFAGKVVSEACYSTDDGSDADPVCPGGVTSSTAAGSGVNCAPGVDGCDHGTHVAGIAAGRSVTLPDGRTIAGVARNANVIAIQVFSRINNATDCGSNPVPCALSYESDQILGLQRVRDLAMMTDGSGNPLFRIASVNMSLGNDDNNTSTCAGDARATAITNLRSLEIATVISAGNEGHTNGVGAPGCNPNAISVASTDKNDTVSSFSNNASFVSLLAPGGSIESSIPGGGYGFKSGTSMAAPQVTGAWAVYKASPGHGSDTVAAVLTQFQNTGVQITDTRNANPSNHVTRPRLRLERALGLFSADLRIVKTDSTDPATAGTNLTYTINVTNDGPDAADNVTVSDTLPANTTFVSNTVPAGWACTTPAVGSGGTVQCTRASVADDETASFSITVKVDEATPNGSTLSNTASVNSSVAFDPNAANNSDTETTAVIARADLEVTAKVDAPDPVVTNFPLVYTITLRNNGPSVAISVTLDEPLPGGALFNTCLATGGGVCGGSGQNRNVTFVSLAVGATATVTFETIANCALSDGSIINNTATISAVTVDPNPANNSASATTVAQNPPPVITCPTDRDVIALTPGSTSAIVSYPDPRVTDNCPGVAVVCVPASGTAFPLGLTTVNCTATDSGGATASCSFNVTVWDACIQDNMSKDYLLFNTFTGDYKFVRCSTDLFIMIGRGQITRIGSVTKLHDDSRVDASFDRALIAPLNTGTATIRRRQPDTVFPLKDRNILDNSPTCP